MLLIFLFIISKNIHYYKSNITFSKFKINLIIDTVDTEENSMKINRKKANSPISIDSDYSENWFNLGEKCNKVFGMS